MQIVDAADAWRMRGRAAVRASGDARTAVRVRMCMCACACACVCVRAGEGTPYNIEMAAGGSSSDTECALGLFGIAVTQASNINRQ